VRARSRFPSPLIKPDMRISRTRLSNRLHPTALGAGPNWTRRFNLDLAQFKNCSALFERARKRPSVQKVLAYEKDTQPRSPPQPELRKPPSGNVPVRIG